MVGAVAAAEVEVIIITTTAGEETAPTLEDASIGTVATAPVKVSISVLFLLILPSNSFSDTWIIYFINVSVDHDPEKPFNTDAEVMNPEAPEEGVEGEGGSREETPFTVVGPKGRAMKGPRGGRGGEGGGGRGAGSGRGRGAPGATIFDYVKSKFDRRRDADGGRGESVAKGDGGSRPRTRSNQRDPDGERPEGHSYEFGSSYETSEIIWDCDPELLKEIENETLTDNWE